MSSKLVFSTVLVLASLLVISSAEASSLTWSHTYGGTGEENAYAMIVTSDGGYAIAGNTNSFCARGSDFWIVKTDAFGNMEWTQTYGEGGETACSLVQTFDQGYAIAGYTYSFGAGSSDFWLVKIDTKGNMEWNQTYGGENADHGYSVVQTPDGGYAVAGYTANPYGEEANDFLLVKTDAMGNMEWNKTYGEDQYDMAKSLIVTSDGGFAITGSKDGRINYSESDFWLIKTDAFGNVEWDREYSNWVDHPNMVIETSDGGYALAGVIGFWYPHAGWLVKTKENGLMDWNKEYGSLHNIDQQTVNAVTETADGGFVLAGQTQTTEGGTDFWIIKTDSTGNVQWNQTFGGTESETPCAIVECPDGCYVIAGTTSSFGAGDSDFWLIKIDTEEIPENNLTIFCFLFLGATLLVIKLAFRKNEVG